MACGIIGFALGAGLLAGSPTRARLAAQLAFKRTLTTNPAVTSSQKDGLAEPDGSLYTLAGSWPAFAHLAAPVVGWTARPGSGAWEVAGDGGVFSRGGAPFYGSTGGIRLDRPIVGMAATPSGHGYWLVASDGGVFSFGDAGFHGSTGGIRLDRPIVGMAATPSGHGYWLVASDGGVFSFGDARFHGSTGGVRLAQPIVGMSSSPSGNGYWLAGADGGIFAFGRSGFAGSAAGRDGSGTVTVAADGAGYDETQRDGSVWTFQPSHPPARHQIPVPGAEVNASRVAGVAATAVSVALSEVGKPYVYGAAGPNAFDCSGLTQYAYARAGVALPRNSAQQLAAATPVPAGAMRPGDLLFFYPGATHVGIYLGNGTMVDAPHAGAAVRVESVAWFGPLVGVGRPPD